MSQQPPPQETYLTEVYGLEADTMSGISKRVSGSWVSGDYGIMGTDTDTITTLPAIIYPNDTTATVGLKGNMEQSGTGTTTVPSKNVTVSNLESGTDYAMFSKTDFPDVAVGDSISIVVNSTTYSQKVKKIDANYVYIENREV